MAASTHSTQLIIQPRTVRPTMSSSSSSSRGATTAPPLGAHVLAFPFQPTMFANLLMKECPGMRRLTGSYDVLHHILHDGQAHYQASQCSLSKALEWTCTRVTRTMGASVHRKFWKVSKFLCGLTTFHHVDHRVPHAYLACMMADLHIVQAFNEPAWVSCREAWLPSTRPQIQEDPPDLAERRSLMYVYILEALVQHQLEYPHVWKFLPDHNVFFMAMTFARRKGSDDDCSATVASHLACMAVRYEMDGSHTGTSAFKGLRRWRNIVPTIAMDLALTCIWSFPETPRHHQLWHFHRLIKERDLGQHSAAIEQGTFLLLVGVMNDHIFASVPPEDAAESVMTKLFYANAPLTPRQHFDIGRLGRALTRPRSPYLHILFPEMTTVTIEKWFHTLQLNLPQ